MAGDEMRLNLGCGQHYADGWINVDRDFPHATGRLDTLRLDLVGDDWPWLPESVDAIVMHHVLDLMTRDEAQVVVQRCFDALRPEGALRVSCAALNRGVDAAIAGRAEFFVEPKATIEESVGFFITQGGARKQYITFDDFADMAYDAKFTGRRECLHRVSRFSDLGELDSRPTESWFGEAWK